MTLSDLRHALHTLHWKTVCQHGACNPNKPDVQCADCRQARQMALELSERLHSSEGKTGENANYWFHYHTHKLIKDVMGW